MRKQLVAAVVAVLLAVVGVFSLISYAQGANDRAFAGTKMTEVLRLTTDVPAGTPVSRVAASVENVKVPAAAVVPGALTQKQQLSKLAGQITTAPLIKGEQLVGKRFGSAEASSKKSSDVPDGMQEVSITVAKPRVAGGALRKGDRVGVIVSYARQSGQVGDTNMGLNGVLVTRVATAAAADGGGEAILVTFAVSTVDAEKIVNASEFGKVWLTLQNDRTDTTGSRRLSAKDVI